jgi:hypothetical protein
MMATFPGTRVAVPESGDLNEVLSSPEWVPGAYCGPLHGYNGPADAVYFLLPCARDEDAPPSLRSVHLVVSPPHTFRECPDGSLEIRQSIGVPEWHCWLDEGNLWRHP